MTSGSLNNLRPAGLSARFSRELDAIAGERDPEMRGEQVLQFAARLEAAGESRAALQVYANASRESSGLDARFCDRAREHYRELTSGGSFESQLRHGVREATDPTLLFGMTAASSAFRLIRLGALASGVRPLGSSLLAFGGEAALFPLATRFGAAALGRELDWSGGALTREWGGSFLTLGALRAGGLAATRIGNWLPESFAQSAFAQSGLRHAGMLGGILLSQEAEIQLGWRSGENSRINQVFATWLQFQVAGRISQSILGPNFAHGESRIDRRILELESRQRLANWTPSLLDFAQPAFAVAIPERLSSAAMHSEAPRHFGGKVKMQAVKPFGAGLNLTPVLETLNAAYRQGGGPGIYDLNLLRQHLAAWLSEHPGRSLTPRDQLLEKLNQDFANALSRARRDTPEGWAAWSRLESVFNFAGIASWSGRPEHFAEQVDRLYFPPRDLKEMAWFAPEDVEPFRLSAEYSERARRWLQEFKRLGKGRPDSSDRAAVLANRPDERTLDRIFHYQLLDLVSKSGASAKFYPATRLIQSFDALGDPLEPGLLESALHILKNEGMDPNAASVLEIRVPFKDLRFGGGFEENYYIGLRHVAPEIEKSLGGRVRLIEIRADHLVVRFPGLSLLERLLSAHLGAAAPQFHYVSGEISRDTTVDSREEDSAPIGMVKLPTAAAEFNGKAPPGFYTLHDLLHAFTYCRLTPEMRRYSAYLYRIAGRKLREFSMTEDHRNELSDMFPGHQFDGTMRSYARHLLAPFWRHVSGDGDAVSSTEKFAVNVEFFSTYLRELRRKPPDDPALAALHADFLAELRCQQEALNELLHQLIRGSRG